MNRAVLTQVRDLMPIRPLTRIEALSVAERQAARLLDLRHVTGPAVPETVISDLPKVQVTRSYRLLQSAMSAWEHGRWRIVINATDSTNRQRFSLAHETKHILDHPFVDQLYGAIDPHERDDWIEAVCDYFAGCLLMPRRWLKHAWVTGNQHVSTLAYRFETSQAAIRTRLAQTGLTAPQRRCDHRHHQPRSYHRTRRYNRTPPGSFGSVTTTRHQPYSLSAR